MAVGRRDAPRIETKRLLLRAFDEADADAAIALYTDPDVMRYIPRGPWSPDGAQTKFSAMLRSRREQWASEGIGMWCLTLRDDGAVIGHCGLQRIPDSDDEIEVYYLLAKRHWGQGLAAEAAAAAMRFGFDEAALSRIVAIAMPENVASTRVMEKAGMHRIGEAAHYGFMCVKFERLRTTAMTRSDPQSR